MTTWAQNIQANKDYPCETCTLLNEKGNCTLDKKEYLLCMLRQKKHHSIRSDTKRIDGHNCAFYGDQENCPVPYDEPVNCGLFHLCETVTTQNKHKKR